MSTGTVPTWNPFPVFETNNHYNTYRTDFKIVHRNKSVFLAIEWLSREPNGIEKVKTFLLDLPLSVKSDHYCNVRGLEITRAHKESHAEISNWIAQRVYPTLIMGGTDPPQISVTLMSEGESKMYSLLENSLERVRKAYIWDSELSTSRPYPVTDLPIPYHRSSNEKETFFIVSALEGMFSVTGYLHHVKELFQANIQIKKLTEILDNTPTSRWIDLNDKCAKYMYTVSIGSEFDDSGIVSHLTTDDDQSTIDEAFKDPNSFHDSHGHFKSCLCLNHGTLKDDIIEFCRDIKRNARTDLFRKNCALEVDYYLAAGDDGWFSDRDLSKISSAQRDNYLVQKEQLLNKVQRELASQSLLPKNFPKLRSFKYNPSGWDLYKNPCPIVWNMEELTSFRFKCKKSGKNPRRRKRHDLNFVPPNAHKKEEIYEWESDQESPINGIGAPPQDESVTNIGPPPIEIQKQFFGLSSKSEKRGPSPAESYEQSESEISGRGSPDVVIEGEEEIIIGTEGVTNRFSKMQMGSKSGNLFGDDVDEKDGKAIKDYADSIPLGDLENLTLGEDGNEDFCFDEDNGDRDQPDKESVEIQPPINPVETQEDFFGFEEEY